MKQYLPKVPSEDVLGDRKSDCFQQMQKRPRNGQVATTKERKTRCNLEEPSTAMNTHKGCKHNNKRNSKRNRVCYSPMLLQDALVRAAPVLEIHCCC
jgi:hypothetical protein